MSAMQLRTRDRLLDLSQPLVMGILNLTPDSFSDGGRYAARDAALRHADQMMAEGAAIIDIGGESTRPGAAPVSVDEELARVVPLIEALRANSDAVISIDTLKPGVMDAACEAGADLINDVLALQAAGALDVALRHRVAVCLMHMQGEPRTMQAAPHYGDVVAEVGAFLNRRLQACVAAGIDAGCVVLDPGFGFGKSLQHNLELLAGLPRTRVGARPILAGLSRKSMFQQLLGLPVDQRLHASVAAATLAVWQGASIIRAHDVRATVEAVRVAAAVAKARETIA